MEWKEEIAHKKTIVREEIAFLREEIAQKEKELIQDRIEYAKEIGNLIKLYKRQGNEEEIEKMGKMIHNIFTE